LHRKRILDFDYPKKLRLQEIIEIKNNTYYTNPAINSKQQPTKYNQIHRTNQQELITDTNIT